MKRHQNLYFPISQRFQPSVIGLAGGIFACLLSLLPVGKAGIGVVADCNEASLRAALASGNVTFSGDGTIPLTSPLLINSDTVIDGTGRQIVLSGENSVRIFRVNAGIRLTLRNLTLANGAAIGTNAISLGGAGEPGLGGAVYNDGGMLTAVDCVFSNNLALGGKGGDAGQYGPSCATGAKGLGGAIYSLAGQVIVTNVSFQGNVAQGGKGGKAYMAPAPSADGGISAGGALYLTNTTATLANCVFATNSTPPGTGGDYMGRPSRSGISFGGAIFAENGTVQITQSKFSGQSSGRSLVSNANASSPAYGGAIFQTNGTLTLSGCLFSTNRVYGSPGAPWGAASTSGGHANGGALCLVSNIASVSQCSFVGNLALGGPSASVLVYAQPGFGFGGGIYSSATLDVVNSTFLGNSAEAGLLTHYSSDPGHAYGGGIYILGAPATLTHVTLASNIALGKALNTNYSAVVLGGGVFSSNATVTLRNCLLAHNVKGTNGYSHLVAQNWYGPAPVDQGNSISSDASCRLNAAGSLTNTEPRLGPLADYGGFTPTLSLLAGSPAIDAGNTTYTQGIDQRGRLRPFPFGAQCDIGAFESSPPYALFGQIHSVWQPPTGFAVAADTTVTNTDPSGRFAFMSLGAGNHLVTPSGTDTVMVASNQMVNLLADTVGVDFHAYRSNALTLEPISASVIRAVFAGTPGETRHLLGSSDLFNWQPCLTNTVQTSGIAEFQVINASEHGRFFRTTKP